MLFKEKLRIASTLANHPEACYVFDNEDDFERVREILFLGIPRYKVWWSWDDLSLWVERDKDDN